MAVRTDVTSSPSDIVCCALVIVVAWVTEERTGMEDTGHDGWSTHTALTILVFGVSSKAWQKVINSELLLRNHLHLILQV